MPAHSSTEGNAHSSIAWLDGAAERLNPLRRPHHSPARRDLRAFLSSAPLPPPALQEQWSTAVWAMPGEPYEVYLLRCLAHHRGLTSLAPHLSLEGEQEEEKEDDGEARASQTPTLLRAHCLVVGLRIEPATTTLVQTGWNAQPCPYCVEGASKDAPVASPQDLPLLYGGDACTRCSRVLPLLPAWVRVSYFVVQRSDRTRVAAVAYGEGVLRHLSLGASVRALLYHSQTEQQEPLLVVHAAEAAAPLPRLLVRPPSYAADTLAYALAHTGAQRGLFRAFYSATSGHPLAGVYVAGPPLSLDDIADATVPKLLGQTRAKTMVLLVVLYTLYRAQHFPTSTPRPPLHLLLLGPAKSGKTSLLCGVRALLGPHAEVLDSTVVRGVGPRRAGGSGASFLSALPYQRGSLRMAGPGMTATTLILDPLLPMASSAAAPVVAAVRAVLERRQPGCTMEEWVGEEGDGAGRATQVTAHLLAAADDESAAALQLAPLFPIVAALHPVSSLGDSALISQDVVAASRARASCSRSASRSASSSTGRGSLSRSQRSASPSHSLARGGSRAAGGSVECLTTEDLQYLLLRAACPALLDTVVCPEVCNAAYLPKLAAAASLLEETVPRAGKTLPPPAACRGQPVQGESVSVAPLCVALHLRVLQCLTQARLLLEPAEEVRRVGLTLAMRDDVWRLYEHHLVTLADLLHRTAGVNPTASSSIASRESCASVCTLSGAGPPKMSKKQRRLVFLDALREFQARAGGGSSSRGSWSGILPAEVVDIYSQMGGSAAFGDSLEAVMGQLREAGVVLAQVGGWRVL